MSYRAFFGFYQGALSIRAGDQGHPPDPGIARPSRSAFDYALRIGAMALVTGEIGSGKSTALRYAVGQLHPSEYVTFSITASAGSILELYRQILAELGIHSAGSSRQVLTRTIRREIQELILGKKMKVALIIDEASLIRLDVFQELHTLTQFEGDSKPFLPIILAGQSNLIDKLSFRTSQPLASRIVARSHLDGVNRQTWSNTSGTTSPSQE